MRLIRFQTDGQGPAKYGILAGQEVTPLEGDLFSWAHPHGPTRSLSSVKLLAPLEPPNVLCLGRNFRSYAGEENPKFPAEPLLFIKATTAMAGPDETIHLPAAAPKEVYFEAELVVVISREARNVAREAALQYVLGYTVGTDLGAKDCQAKDGQWARAKSFDGFAPMGPWIETELDPSHLRLRSRINGKPVQDASTDLMIFDVATTISHLSQWMKLLPGTAIMMGSPGVLQEPRPFLKPGDVFEAEIEGIGVLRNAVSKT